MWKLSLKNLTVGLSLLLSCSSYAADEQRLNKGLPMMVDSKTELKDILLKGMTVIYTYQLKNIEINEARELKNKNKYLIEHNACADEKIQCLFKKDLNVKFVYKIKNEEILDVTLSQDICSHLDRPNSAT